MISRHLFISCFLFLISFAVVAQSITYVQPTEKEFFVLKAAESLAKQDLDSTIPLHLIKQQINQLSPTNNLYEQALVRFVEVTIKNIGNKPQLTWQVTDEQHVAYYSIERSYNGSFFEEGGKAPFKNATTALNTYTFTDHNLAAEDEVYYRIKQVDNDGKYLYSKIVSLKLAPASAIQLIPNPAYDKTVVQVSSSRQVSGVLQLVNAAGITIKQERVEVKKGINKLVVEGLQQYPAGTYYIKLVLPDGTLHKKLLLQ